MPDNNLPPVPPLRGWPGKNELLALLESCGVVDTTSAQFGQLNLQAKIEAAIDTFEEQTQWTPFLADGNPTTRTYDFPAGGYLNLDGGLVTLTSVASGGQVLTAGLHYIVKPDNAPQRKKPYTSMALRGGLSVPLGTSYGYRRTVDVTGVWGFAASLPASVFDAVLGYAAALCVPQIALNISKGLYEKRAGDEMERFGGAGHSPLSAEAAMWTTTFTQAVKAKKRIRL